MKVALSSKPVVGLTANLPPRGGLFITIVCCAKADRAPAGAWCVAVRVKV
jgi:hypothetical protein